MEVLGHTPDQFGGVIVSTEQVPLELDEFTERLRHSVETWRSDGKRLAWVDVPRSLARHIPIAVDEGFVFHHADDDHVMLVCKLVEDAFVPMHATHYIGVGGVV